MTLVGPLLLLLFCLGLSFPQSVSGSCSNHCDSGHLAISLPDDGMDGYFSSMTLSGISGSVVSVQVQTFITHPLTEDLQLYLSFAGVLVPLAKNEGDFRPNCYNGTIWNDLALYFPQEYPNFVYDVTAPALQADGYLSDFNGNLANGVWTLIVFDSVANENSGILDRWIIDVNGVVLVCAMFCFFV